MKKRNSTLSTDSIIRVMCILFGIIAMINVQMSPVNAQATFHGDSYLIPLTPGATSGPASGTLEVACVGEVTDGADITVDILIRHTFMGDLNIWLVAPGGQVLELSTRNGGANDNANFHFTDNAISFPTTASACFTGTIPCPPPNPACFAFNGDYRPEGRNNVVTAFNVAPSNAPALGTFTFANTFSGINADGTWTLITDDGFAGDAGAVCAWSITFDNVILEACDFTDGPVLPAIIVPLNIDNCVSEPIDVPATSGACEGLVISASINGGAFMNLPPGATTLDAGLPVGNHTIVWQTLNECLQTSTATQNVEVQDLTVPTVDCPANITVTLNPGECERIVNYEISAPETCPELVAVWSNNDTTSFAAGLSLSCGPGFFTNHYFQVYDAPSGASEAAFARVGIVSTWPGGGSSPASTITVRIYTLNNPALPYNVSAANRTLLGASAPTAIPPGSGGQKITIPLPAGIIVPDGSKILMETESSWAFTVADGPGTGQNTWIGAPACGLSPDMPVTQGSIGFALEKVMLLYLYTTGEANTPVLSEGLESGSFFPIGTTTNCYQIIDEAGTVVSECCFDVTVLEFPNPIQALACNSLVHISLDDACEVIINADVILEGGPYRCYDNYEVYLDQYPGIDINNVPISPSLGLHTVTVVDPVSGISCWGYVLIEDKVPPVLECHDVTVFCGQEIFPNFNAEFGTVMYSGPAAPVAIPDVDLAGVDIPINAIGAPAGAVVTSVTLALVINHTWVGDLSVTLQSPAGAVSQVFHRPGVPATFFGCPGDNLDVVFYDAAPNSAELFELICGNLPAIAGDFQPIDPFAVFNGSSANGTWTINVVDHAGGDVGTVVSYTLEIDYLFLPGGGVIAPITSDNCGDPDLTFTDAVFGDVCDNFIIRTWTATDASGNTATCQQTITILPLDLDNLECPPAFEGVCGQSTHPPFTGGWPTVNGVQISGNTCNIFLDYWDKEIDDCGNAVKIIRTWTIIDWCTQEIVNCVQLIKLADMQPPVLDCPPDQTVSADPWHCLASVVLQLPDAHDECGSAFTLTPSVSAGTLLYFGGTNWRVDNLPLGTHTVTWTAVDVCDNDTTCTYTITVIDDIPPVPVCDHHTVVGLTFGDPVGHGLTKIFAETFDDGSWDNCGPVTFLARRMTSCIDFDWIGPGGEYPNSDGLVTSLDRGLTFQPWVPFACCDVGAGYIMVELRVTDASGNINSCMVEVEVQDKIPPFLECPPDITVSCIFWFDAHPTVGFQPTDGLESIFGRVLDAYDFHPSDRQPIIINDPGNTTLPQPFNWGLDGWANDNCNVNIDVRLEIFDDCSGDNLPGIPPNNAVRLLRRTFRAQDSQGNVTTCIQRIWVVDFQPFFITDTQCGLVNADFVRWPCDLTLTDCPQGELTPENLSAFAPNNRPQIRDHSCSIIGVTYDDQVFYFVDDACYKIVRTWTIIDWCQFDPITHSGYWTYVQVIKVHDNDAPVFLDCPAGPVTYCVDDPNVELPSTNWVYTGEGAPGSSHCSVHIWLEHTVRETCSNAVIYDVKVYPYNGTEFIQIVNRTTVPVDPETGEAVLRMDTRQNSLPANHPVRLHGLPYNERVCSAWPLPGGVKDYHRILWSVEDGCGNINTCEYLFRLEDCKKPTPVCVNLSSVVMPSSGDVVIWAKDFDASSFDDCTPAKDLLFSFSGTVYQPSRNFSCEAIAENGGPTFLVQIWVGDEGNDHNCSGFVQPIGIEWSERNKDFCTTFIIIDDNENVCPGSVVGGIVETEDYEPVERVRVTMTNQFGQSVSTYTTVGDGAYHFLNPLLDYTVVAERNDEHRNGVSTLDLIEIQRHLLGVELLGSPYKIIAADANDSESISAVDLIEIRKLILGIYTEFPKNKSWRFVDAKFEFEDPTNPWPFAEILDIEGFQNDLDFVAVKIGDVNGTVVANAQSIKTRNATGLLEFVTDAQRVVAGETVTVPVSGVNFKDILGYQFTLRTQGLTLQRVEAGSLDMGAEHIGVHTNALTLSWSSALPVSSSDVLFTLTFTAQQSGNLSEMLAIEYQEYITEAEAYGTDKEILDVSLNFGAGVVLPAAQEFALFQNEPNPFDGLTMITFTLPQAMDATLTVFDVTGKVVHMIEGSYAQGYNKVSVNRTDLGSAGVLYYRLDAEVFTATKKMVIID